MQPLPLLPAYRNEDVLNTDRAPPGGFTPDPRAPGRALRTRTRYLRDPRDAEAHEIVVENGRLRKALSGDCFATGQMFPGVRGLDGRPAGRAIFTLALDGRLYAGDVTVHAIGVREWVSVRAAPASPEARAAYLPDVLEVWHHSSFVAGADVLCCGEIATDAGGRVVLVSNFSGHYQPDLAHLVGFLAWLGRALPLEGVIAEVITEADEVWQADAAELVRTAGRPSGFRGYY